MLASMSDRDKKLILILLIAMIIFLPYYFVIKDKKVETESLKAENEQLEERLAYLQELNTHREDYIKETEQYKADTVKIVAKYPADIKPENYIQFLLNTERSEEETYPMIFDTVSFGTNIVTPVGSEDVVTDYSFVMNESSVTYVCYYDGLKYMLKYLSEYKDPMTFRGLSVKYDPETGEVSGEIILDQYAVQGGDQGELPKVVIDPDLDDPEYDMRGNEEIGIFGPVKNTVEMEETEGTEEVEEEAEEAAE